MKPTVKKGEIKRVRKVEPSEADVDEVNQEESLLDIVEQALEAEGIEMFTNENIVKDYLLLPPHLDDEEPSEIGRYLHALTQQRVWTRTLLARIGILLREANELLDKEKARVFSDLPAKMSVTEKELALYIDVKALPILERIKVISAKYNMLEAYMKNLEDLIFDVSREISRRGFDVNSQNRTENVNNIRRGK